jgi:tetrahydromethanopterin S-methyltransferase subunit G
MCYNGSRAVDAIHWQDPEQEQATMEEIQEAATADIRGTEKEKGKRIGRTVGIVLGVVLALAIIGACLYGLVSNPPFTAVLRDVFIIVLALVTVIIGLFLIILIFQLQSLMALLRDEIKPILESANQTASTVRGTTTFVSDAVVTPMIQAAGLAAGIRQTLKTLVGDSRERQRRRGPRQESQSE